MQFTAKTFHGLENILFDELKNIGAKNIKIIKRAVRFTGDNEIMYKANYLLRTAVKVLWEIKTFRANSTEELYENVKKIDWTKYMSKNKTFAIDKTVFSKTFNHSNYAALKTKDAIADFFNEKYNERPSVDVETPDVKVNLHISNNQCTISIDTSGDALFKRGYRKRADIAPINEVLAAGMLMLSNLKNKDVLFDPMCGSGTILIEAASILLNRPAGYRRRSFGFERLPDFDSNLWFKIKEDAEKNIKKEAGIKITGSDNNFKALSAARQNIANAFLTSEIDVKKEDFFDAKVPGKKGILITNPPYDVRLKVANIDKLYYDFGKTLKSKYYGWEIYVISANEKALENIKLKKKKVSTLYNGKLLSKFIQYNLHRN